MRGVLQFSVRPKSPLSGLIAGVIVALGLVAGTAQADEREALLGRIAATGPLPCDQQATAFMNLQLQRMEPDLVLQGIRKSMGLGDTWAPGNSFYDQARTLLAAAFEEDAAKNGPFFVYTPEALVGKGLSGMSSEDLQYLAQFFARPEGKLYWEETLDGSTCAAWFKAFGRAPYPAPDAATAAHLESTTATLKGGHDRFVKRLNALPKATQTAYYDGSDKISTLIQQAPMKSINERNQELAPRLTTIVKSKMPELTTIIDGFKGVAKT